MTNILAIEASEKYCSVALAKTNADGSETCISRFEEAPRKHAELILPMVEALLLESKLTLPAMDCVTFTRGPGAFTGVRIAASLVQGLAFSAEIPVAPISTLELIAYQAAQQDSLFEQKEKRQPIIVALDARMDEVYLGAYETPLFKLSVEAAKVNYYWRHYQSEYIEAHCSYSQSTAYGGWLYSNHRSKFHLPAESDPVLPAAYQ